MSDRNDSSIMNIGTFWRYITENRKSRYSKFGMQIEVINVITCIKFHYDWSITGYVLRVGASDPPSRTKLNLTDVTLILEPNDINFCLVVAGYLISF